MPQIYDMGQTALLPLRREGVLRIFFALKNPTASAGFEPANLGTKGRQATLRPPIYCNTKFLCLGLFRFLDQAEIVSKTPLTVPFF